MPVPKDLKSQSAKWHRCIKKVTAAGGKASPQAVCTASLRGTTKRKKS